MGIYLSCCLLAAFWEILFLTCRDDAPEKLQRESETKLYRMSLLIKSFRDLIWISSDFGRENWDVKIEKSIKVCWRFAARRIWYLSTRRAISFSVACLIGIHWFTAFDLTALTFRPKKKSLTKCDATRESLKKWLSTNARLDDTEKLNIKNFIARSFVVRFSVLAAINRLRKKNPSRRSQSRFGPC